MKRKVYVGLSGGVDSAVSAALLQEQGYDVVGVFIKIWQPEFIECTWAAERLDALRVCAALGIPFREVDFSEEYKRNVIDTMIADYARGITPNPDVLCNRHIKFGVFARWAFAEGADLIATGHYAQVREQNGSWELHRGKDAAKDQSYFLYRLTAEDLSRALFPVGSLLKHQVREEAKRFKLPTAQKPDSQGLCFVGEVSMADFLSRFISVTKGPVLLGTEVIGEHGGAALYTIGQRHGFSTDKAQAGPYYVTNIDVVSNTLHVSHKKEDAMVRRVGLENVHWIHEVPQFPATYTAQVRYHGSPVGVSLSKENEKMFAEFDTPQVASAGQSLVIYEGSMCKGGGIIA